MVAISTSMVRKFELVMSQAEDVVPKPLLAQLRSTTTSPIFVHPIKWSKLHLALLRVRGLDQDYPLERVVGRDHLLSSSDTIDDKAVADILREVSVGDFYLMKHMKNLQEVRKNCQPENCLERSLLCVSIIWLNKIYEAKDYSKILCRWRPSDAPDKIIYLSFGNEKPQRLLCQSCIHNWPDENEYPASFPIVAVVGRTRDYYEPRLTPNISLWGFDRWKRKRKTADRDAEEVALLIALAQKHAEVLKVSRFAEDDAASRSVERLYVFHPVLMIATATTIRFIKAHITLEYLRTLEDPTLPLLHDLIIEKSVPIDMKKDDSVPQLLAAMAALIDDFTMHMGPLLARRLPVPWNPILLDRHATGFPQSLPRRHRQKEPHSMRPSHHMSLKIQHNKSETPKVV